jgi:hypothetical protein
MIFPRTAAILALCFSTAFSLTGLADPPSADRLPREDLLVYHGADGQRHRAQTVEQWQLRRAEIVRGMETVMGRLPGDEKRCPLEVEVAEEVDCGSYVRKLLYYSSEPGSRVPAYLLVPKKVLEEKGKAHAVLCLHGTDDKVGHGLVVGLGGKPTREYARELAEKGYVTLAPNYPLLAKYQPDVKSLGWESGTLKAVWDNIRGLDLLETLPYVHPGRFAAIGHSLGGHNSVYTAVFDSRIVAVVSSCGLDSYLDYYSSDPGVWEPGRGWVQDRYMMRLADYRGRLEAIPFDFHELIGALAPRRVFISAPLGDGNFKWDSVDRIVAAARPIFALYGESDHLQMIHPDCGHDLPDEVRRAAYDWINKSFESDKP